MEALGRGLLWIILSPHTRSRFFFFQAEDGIRDLVRSRGLGDVYKRQDPGGHGGRLFSTVSGAVS